MCKIGTFQENLSKIFLKVLNIYLFSKIFPKVKIVMLRWNILQYLSKMLRQYFNCNEILEIFLTCFCDILCYVDIFIDLFISLSPETLIPFAISARITTVVWRCHPRIHTTSETRSSSFSNVALCGIVRETQVQSYTYELWRVWLVWCTGQSVHVHVR